MLIVGGRRDSAGLIIRAMLVETGERGPCWADNKSYVDCWWEGGQCWTDNKSYVDCWWEEGQCWTDNKRYVGGDWGEGTVLG